jgi:hypothetical protein
MTLNFLEFRCKIFGSVTRGTLRFWAGAVVLVALAGIMLTNVWARSGTDADGLPVALEIARNVEFVNRFRTVRNITYGTGKARLVLIDRAPGKSPMVNTLQRYRNNDYGPGSVAAKDLVIFRGGKLRSTGILITDYVDPDRSSSYSMWLPSLRKIRRFAEPDPADTWGGSNFTYGDIYLRRARDEQHELLGIERFPDCLGAMAVPEEQKTRVMAWLPARRCGLSERETFKLKSSLKRPDSEYEYRIVWVDRETFADYRSVFYKDGRPLKHIDKDWRSMGLTDTKAQYWVYWYALTYADGHEGMAFINPHAVVWNTAIDPKLWTERTLRRIKR